MSFPSQNPVAHQSLLLEHLRDKEKWLLQDDQKPVESTDSHYRFYITLDATNTMEFVVAEKRSELEKVDAVADLKVLKSLIATPPTSPDDVCRAGPMC